MKQNHLERISINPEVCFGKPCIKGHRIWVSLILDMLTDGMSIEEVLGEYPQLVREDILACLAYAAEMTRERAAAPAMAQGEGGRLRQIYGTI